MPLVRDPFGNIGTQRAFEGWPKGRERRRPMAPLSSNPDYDFSAGYGNKELDLGDWWSEPAPSLEELFNDATVRKRVGKVISDAAQRDF